MLSRETCSVSAAKNVPTAVLELLLAPDVFLRGMILLARYSSPRLNS